MSMNLRNLERFLEEVLVFEIQLKRLTKMENFVCSVDDEEEEEAIFGGFFFLGGLNLNMEEVFLVCIWCSDTCVDFSLQGKIFYNSITVVFGILVIRLKFSFFLSDFREINAFFLILTWYF